MGAVRRGTAIASYAHGTGAAGEHALDGESCPFAHDVTVFFEEFIPAFIEGEEQFCGARNIHGVVQSPGILPVKRKGSYSS